MSPFVFPGVRPYIQEAAKEIAVPNPGNFATALLRGEGSWHVSQIQNALSPLSRIRSVEGRLGVLEHANTVRQALAATLQGIDKAILESVEAFDLPTPEWAKEEEISPDAAAHLRNPHVDGLRNDVGPIQDRRPPGRDRSLDLGKRSKG